MRASIDSAWLNPLALDLLQLLRCKPEGYAIHHLVAELEALRPFPELARARQLGLFKKNFLVMNALFELQQCLFDDGLYLQISTLSIRLLPCHERGARYLAEHSQGGLRDYYLDWTNYTDTSLEEVEALLQQFLQGGLAPDRRQRALEVLDLDADASGDEIRLQYRRLAARCHPDRGGDPQRFIAIRGAWELLKNADCQLKSTV